MDQPNTWFDRPNLWQNYKGSSVAVAVTAEIDNFPAAAASRAAGRRPLAAGGRGVPRPPRTDYKGMTIGSPGLLLWTVSPAPSQAH